MTYYAGLDVSLRTVNICVIDEQGELVAETKLTSDVQDIVAYLDELALDLASVGLEAGTLTQYLTSKCVDLENEVRGLFKIFGIKLPPKLGHGAFDTAVRDIIETAEKLSHALLPLLEARLVLYQTFRVLDNRTRKMAHADTVCVRLMSVPGVGFITALTFKAGVDDPHRFKRSRTVGAYFGLTARRFQSGEMDIDGHISRCGDADVRGTLYTAANALLTRSSRWSPLKAWGMKLAKTRGHCRAVIAVARKLAVILHRVWIDDTQFRWGTEGARS